MYGSEVLQAVRGDTVTSTLYSSLSAQTGKIPFDVLSMVFSLLTEDDWICVSGVCRHWRAAALGDKRLWCNITIRAAFSTAPVVHMPRTRNAAFGLNDSPPCCSLSQTSLPVSSNHRILPVLLRRSGNLPISLDFHFSVHYDMRLVHSSIIAITENASRIRSLTIRAEGCPAWMSMLASLPECMPLLSRIVLCISEIAPTRSHDIYDFGLRSHNRWARYRSLSHVEMNGIADGFGRSAAVQCPTVTTVLIGHVGITPSYLEKICYLFPTLCSLEILGCRDGAPGQWHTHHPSVDVPTTLTELRTGRFQTTELTRWILCMLRARRLPTLSVWIPLPSALQFTDIFSHLGPLYDVAIDIDDEQHDCSLTCLDVAGYRRRAIMHNPFGGVPQFLDLIAPLDLSCLVSLTIPNHFWEQMLRSFGSGGVSFPALRTFCFTFIPYLRFVGVVGFMHATNSMRRMRGAASENESESASDVPLAAGPHCALSTVSRTSVPLRWPALRSLEFRKWRDCEEDCVVPIQMLVDVAESFDFDADQHVEINIRGLAVVDSKGRSLDDGLLRLRRLASVSKLVYGRRVY